MFLWSRAAIWALAVTTVVVFEASLNPERGRWDSERLHELGRAVDVWARWDSDWYLRIAADGYSWPSSTPAFFPLYPLLVATAGRMLAGHYLLAGVLVSTAAAAAAFVLLHRLTLPKLGAAGARRAVLYLALFPTSLFLTAVYSEALFLALALAAFLLAERHRFGWVGLVVGLALLTRPAGVALLAAAVLFAWRAPHRLSALARLLTAPALFLLYPLALWVWIDRPLAFLDAQVTVWRRSFSPYGPLAGLWQAMREPPLLELAFLVGLVLLAVHAWRRFGAPYGGYVLVAIALPLAAPAEGRPLLSITRFGLVAFPALLALADLGGRRWVHVAAVAMGATWLTTSVVKWSLWNWVA
jgi:mannosyltransferase PIG-V